MKKSGQFVRRAFSLSIVKTRITKGKTVGKKGFPWDTFSRLDCLMCKDIFSSFVDFFLAFSRFFSVECDLFYVCMYKTRFQ